MRLDKYLADMGAGTRSTLKKAIRGGLVRVNGAVMKDAGAPVSPQDDVRFDGRSVRYEVFSYWMMNKPAGVLSATTDAHQETVLDLLLQQAKEDGAFIRRDLAPVGRLDKDTEGLLLLTNDGQLAHRLLAPANHVPKKYIAVLDAPATPEDVRRFAEGLRIPDDVEAGSAKRGAGFIAMPAKLVIPKPDRGKLPGADWMREIVSPDTATSDPAQHFLSEVTVYEGHFHEVKRMFRAVGKNVLYLKRISMGPIVLDDSLKAGQSRKLTKEEISLLMFAHSGKPADAGPQDIY